MEKIVKFLKEEKLLFLITIAAFILRLIFMSPWLEDWDSVQFALALHNYSLVDHQPHPPGYPLYIVLGKFLNLFFKNDTVSLTFLSALLGSLSSLPLFLILRSMINRTLALLSTILFLITPLNWLLSEVALSNIPGMFFTITTAWLLYTANNSTKKLYLASFLTGITLGVRFAEYFILIALLILTFAAKNISKNRLPLRKLIRQGAPATLLFSLGVLSWLVPVIADTGLTQFINLYTSQVSYILNHDSIVQYTSLLDRLGRIWELFNMGYSVFFLPVLISIILYIPKTLYLLMCKRSTHPMWVSLTHREFWPLIFASVWLLSYLIPLIFIYNLEVPRHVLPLLPPLVLLSSLSLNKIFSQRSTMIIYIIIVLFLSRASFLQVQQFKTSTPPSIVPVLYIKENFDPKNTLLITDFTYRQFQYYAPEFKSFYGSKNTPVNITSDSVVTDYVNTKNQVSALGNYQIVETKEFTGPENLFPRLPHLNLYILKPKI